MKANAACVLGLLLCSAAGVSSLIDRLSVGRCLEAAVVPLGVVSFSARQIEGQLMSVAASCKSQR